MGGKDCGSNITFEAHGGGTNTINTQWFDEATIQNNAKRFVKFVDEIIDGKDNINLNLIDKIDKEKSNDLLITIYNKLDPIITEILGLTHDRNNYNIAVKNIQKKYNLEKNDLIGVIRNIIQDVLKLSIGLKAEGLDENFNSFLDEIDKKGAILEFSDLIDFITVIESIVLQSIKSHIEGRKWVEGNGEKIKDLINILTLERKRLVEQYLYKYNIDNKTKLKIISAMLSEENFNINIDSIDKYIIYLNGFRHLYIKLQYFSN